MNNIFKLVLIMIFFLSIGCQYFTLMSREDWNNKNKKNDNGFVIFYQKMFGGSGIETISTIIETREGGFLLVGSSSSTDIPGTLNHGGVDIYVIKLDKYFNISWQKLYGGSATDAGKCALQTVDGDFLIGSISNSTDISGITNLGNNDIYLMKLDGAGNIKWQMNYGYTNSDTIASIIQTSDGGYMIGGYSLSLIPGVAKPGAAGDYDSYLIKIDASGNIAWQKMYGHGAGVIDGGFYVQETNNNNFIMTTNSNLAGLGGYNYYIVRTDSSGNQINDFMYGGNNTEEPYGFCKDLNGDFIIAGHSSSTNISGAANHGSEDFYIMKIDSNANILWQKLFGGAQSDWAYSVAATDDGGTIIAGNSNSIDIPGVDKPSGSTSDADYYFIKLDSSGNIMWQKMFGGTSDDSAWSVCQTSEGAYIAAGVSKSTDIAGTTKPGGTGNDDIYVVLFNYFK